jgi:DNA polymerase I-like protein with 3'-5' exonuclease and polymerase domains
LNVLLQSSGALIMKQVVINLHDSMYKTGYQYGIDWQQHAMIHDEIEISCKEKNVKQIKTICLKAFEDAGKFFGFRCPVDGDAKVGSTWYEVH